MHSKIFIAFLLLSTACTPRPKPPSVTAGGIAVAQVGSTIITDKDLMSRIEAIEKNFPRTYSTHVQKKQLLEEMMHIELLYQRAIELGLDKRYEFKSRLADLYIQQLAEQARSKITDAEVKKEYESNLDTYQQVSARHILLKFPNNPTPTVKLGLRAKLTEIRDTALKDPSQFSELAKKYSQDGSASNGGELGFFNAGMMVAPFSKAAFALKNVGDISNIIETQYGFHIIQLSGDHRSMDFFKDAIRDRLLRSSQRARLDTEIAQLSSKVTNQIYEDNLAKLSSLPAAVTTDPEKLVPPEDTAKKSP